MINKGILIAMSAFGLSSCGSSDMKADNAEIIHRQTGRFVIIAASDGFPPMVLDTAAGCVMTFAKDESGEMTIDEVSFVGGPSSCNASKQLLVADTLSRVTQ